LQRHHGTGIGEENIFKKYAVCRWPWAE